jgi:predicted permease
MNVAGQVLVLFLLIVVGYAARKSKALDDAAVDAFSRFVLRLSLPALILGSLQRPFSPELAVRAAGALGLSLAVYAAAFALAAVYPALIRARPGERGVHQYALVFSNVGFMGYPVVQAILGPEALFELAVFNIPFNLLAFSVGAWLVARDGHRPLKLGWRSFVNPAIVATVFGFALFLLGWTYPAPLGRTLEMIGATTSPLSMIVIGAILARLPLRRALGGWRVAATAALRLLALPALGYLVLRAAGLRGLALQLPVITLAMPVAANTSIMANVYAGDVESASSLVFVSTLACVLTVPLVAALLSAV